MLYHQSLYHVIVYCHYRYAAMLSAVLATLGLYLHPHRRRYRILVCRLWTVYPILADYAIKDYLSVRRLLVLSLLSNSMYQHKSVGCISLFLSCSTIAILHRLIRLQIFLFLAIGMHSIYQIPFLSTFDLHNLRLCPLNHQNIAVVQMSYVPLNMRRPAPLSVCRPIPLHRPIPR